LYHNDNVDPYHEEDPAMVNLRNMKPITFTPASFSTQDGEPDKNLIGYFWDLQDKDEFLIYPGKARIGNDQYINVMILNSKNVDTSDTDDADIDAQNILKPQNDPHKLNPQDLPQIGTFMKNGEVYKVYGQYTSTVLPNPNPIDQTGKDTNIEVLGTQPSPTIY